MSYKIKIVVSFLIGLSCFVSCAFDGNLGFYEIKINEWAKVTYWFQEKNDTSSIRGFRLYATKKNLEIDRRYDLDDSDRDNQILQLSSRIVYNDSFIISDDGYLNSEFCKYYRIRPVANNGNGKPIPFALQKITRQEYDSIATNCKDCKTLDNARLQNIQYEEEEKEKNSFQTKIVIFFSLIFLYVFYRIYKREKKKKARRK